MLVGWPVSCHAGNSFWECSASCSVQSEKAKSIARCRNCGGLGKFDLFVWAGGPDTLSYRPSQVNPFPAWPSFLSQDLELDVDYFKVVKLVKVLLSLIYQRNCWCVWGQVLFRFLTRSSQNVWPYWHMGLQNCCVCLNVWHLLCRIFFIVIKIKMLQY